MDKPAFPVPDPGKRFSSSSFQHKDTVLAEASSGFNCIPSLLYKDIYHLGYNLHNLVLIKYLVEGTLGTLVELSGW